MRRQPDRSQQRKPGLGKWSYLGFGVVAGLLLGVLWPPVRAPVAAGAPLVPLPEAAATPPRTPPADWRLIAGRAFKEFNQDRITAVAAGATFFSLLALFPALGVFVSLYGLFGDVDKARAEVFDLAGVLPDGGVTILTQQIDHLAALPHQSLGLTFATSLLLSIWSANAGMKALIGGLDIAYEQPERRKFIELNLQSLALTTGAIGLALVGTVAIGATPRVLRVLHLPALQSLTILRWPLLLAVMVTIVSVLYRFGPSWSRTPWRWLTPGGLFAGFGWVAMSFAFSLYVDNFGTYDRTYGSLGAAIGFMIWIWLTLTVILAGAELNREVERQAAP
jgi:membrane protein